MKEAKIADAMCGMRALSIRQPYAELILRGIKRIEYRSRPTRIIGERFWIYAAGKKWSGASGRWAVKQADNIVVPSEPLPPWMLELAEGLRLFPHELPTGVIVGSAVIERCAAPVPSLRSDASSPIPLYEWHLTGVERVAHQRKPRGHPQPVWFKPF